MSFATPTFFSSCAPRCYSASHKLTDNSDPPSLLAGTELRDLSFRPTAIHNAHVTIVHPQLRDLILPLNRGRVLFPHGTSIDEMIWTPEEAEDDDDEEGVQAAVASDRARSGKVPVSVTGSSRKPSGASMMGDGTRERRGPDRCTGEVVRKIQCNM